MSYGSGGAFRVLAFLMLGAVPALASSSDHALEPYQMVRSLQLVQDRIADGDHAALPMQRKLLELIDGKLQGSSAETLEQRRNFNALMIYAMSGGNPSTVSGIVARIQLTEADRQAAAGVLGYLLGDLAQARKAMSTIQPDRYQTEVAAFLSLIKGSVMGAEEADRSIAVLDHARLLSPGTLVEEAALRRTIALAVSSGNIERFASASEQYARRYLRSPYATQFAESFVSGVVALRPQNLHLAAIEGTIAWMTDEQARTVYLRLARRAAIDGDAALLEFASQNAKDRSGLDDDSTDTRGDLYSSLSSVTSETVEDVLSRLQALDPSQLSASDRALLGAAKAVAAEVIAPVAIATPVTTVTTEDPPEHELQPGSLTSELIDETDDPLWEADPLITSARSRLEAIDKILEEAGQ